jgi:hypothetical protein
LSGPVWILNGRKYKSIRGLFNAITADCGATAIGQFSAMPERRLRCYDGAGRIIALYKSSEPKVGEPMLVERVAL